jgi:hypothetical protein
MSNNNNNNSPSALSDEDDIAGEQPLEFRGRKVSELEALFRDCSTLRDIIQVYWDHSKTFHHIKIAPTTGRECNAANKIKDLLRERFIVQGDVFEDHIYGDRADQTTAGGAGGGGVAGGNARGRAEDMAAAFEPVARARSPTLTRAMQQPLVASSEEEEEDSPDHFAPLFGNGGGGGGGGGGWGGGGGGGGGRRDGGGRRAAPANGGNGDFPPPTLGVQAAGSEKDVMAERFRRVISRLNAAAKDEFLDTPEFARKCVAIRGGVSACVSVCVCVRPCVCVCGWVGGWVGGWLVGTGVSGSVRECVRVCMLGQCVACCHHHHTTTTL